MKRASNDEDVHTRAMNTTELTHSIRMARSFCSCFNKNAHNLASLRFARRSGIMNKVFICDNENKVVMKELDELRR